MKRVVLADDILNHMEVPGERNLFVVGCFEKRVTLLSQQVRALNLVFALHECKRLSEGSKVAVIGAGAAGMTAAAAAARLGCKVTLLERQESWLPLLRGNTTRWLHPHIYDWPLEDSERGEADLPLFSWKAGVAAQVVAQFDDAWKNLPERSRIRTFFKVGSMDVHLGGQGIPRLVSWNSPGLQADSFDVVLLTIGFGLESRVEGIQWSSYWDDDSLHQSAHGGSESYLISGCGDGGFVELLRLRLRDFRHENVLDSLLSTSGLGPLKARLLEIEEQARRDSNSDIYLFKEYSILPVPSELDEAIEARIRSDKTAVLNGLNPSPLSLQSSILNRLLVSRLLFRFGVPYRPGGFSYVRDGEFYKVQFKTGEPQLFHRIICRHGPRPGALEGQFPEIWKKCQAIQARSGLDQTRWPIWPKGFFSFELRPTSNRLFATVDERPLNGVGQLHGEEMFVQQAHLPTAPGQGVGAQSTSHDDPTGVESTWGDGGWVMSGAVAAESAASASQHPLRQAKQEQASGPAEQANTTKISEQKKLDSSGPGSVSSNPRKARRATSVISVVLCLAVAWFMFLKDRQRVRSGESRLRVPEDMNIPIPGRPDGQQSGDVKSGLVKSISQKIKSGAGSPKMPDALQPGGEVSFAGGTVRTPQQLRSVHRVRALVQGEEAQLLDSLPVGVFGFVDPSDPIPLGQARVSSLQAANTVEVHKLTNGQLHLVGYVWDVESRAIGTGRPVDVKLFFQPFGHSRSLVSIPFGRIRSVDVKNEQGRFLMELDLIDSSGM